MLEAKHINFGYSLGKPLFQDLNLVLKPGCLAGLFGLNGAGKTTLMKLLCGLQFPRSGETRLLGRDVHLRHPAVLRELLFVAEDAEPPELSVRGYEHLYAPFYPRFSRRQFHESLKALGLDPESRQKMHRMSFGQRKKCILSFALAANTPLLLLDEPTNGLDIPAKVVLRRLLAGAAADDCCIIVSTHQVRELDMLLDPVVILHEGRILLNAPVAEIGRRLSFHVEAVRPADGDRLYAEPGAGGWRIVRECSGDTETQVDLELLFNAVLANPVRIRELFSGEVASA